MKKINKFIVRVFVYLLNHHIWIPDLMLVVFDYIVWSDQEYLEEFLTSIKPGVLEDVAKKKLLFIFQRAVKTTPAYRKFLDEHGVNPSDIKTIEDFSRLVPQTTKQNYVKTYPLEQRCVGGRLPKDGIIFRSAGVAGNPTYWTQALKEEDKFEVFVPFGIDYIVGYKGKEYKILNCWAFGTWPTAIDFTKSARKCGQMINIGTDINELITTLKLLGPKHNYLISGYPPFLRNMITEGERQGITWSQYHIDVITGGEGFVEEWRDYLKTKLGKKCIIASSYGSTDKGLAEGFETPLSIILRNLIRINQVYLFDKKLASEIAKEHFINEEVMPTNEQRANAFIKELFGRDPIIEKRLPMIFQSVPISYFEEQVTNKTSTGVTRTELLTTVLKSHASQPIIRYNIEDDSGMIGYSDVFRISSAYSYNLKAILKNQGNDINKILPLPFIYVFGRSDGTVSIDGSNIYPEEVGRMIENLKEVSELVASFQMAISDDYRFEIDLELKNGTTSADVGIIKRIFENQLPNYSNGYKLIVDSRFKSANILVKLFQFAEGPFEKSPLINRGAVKYQYIGKKIFGK
ncbi:MAG: hypothetical protein WCT08_02140 [Patescibacteria group bacterium]|jgi:phenylacetate-CoA ligase